MNGDNVLYTGWLELSVSELLDMHRADFSRYSVLVTSIDSETDLLNSSVVRSIAEHEEGCRFLGRSLVIPGRRIHAIAKEFELFHGFDELWCFSSEPREKPDDLWLVAPLDLRSDVPPSNLNEWLLESGCDFGVGDGYGLNYATLDANLARLLNGLSKARSM